MATAARLSELSEIEHLREEYRDEMKCQIVHESIHRRTGWTREYALELDGATVGYGSVAIAGPWRDAPALYEFYVQREERTHTFDLFASLRDACGAEIIETQSNAPMLTVMLHTFARNIRAEAILFRDAFQTSLLAPAGVAGFRAMAAEDTEILRRQGLDDGAGWVVTLNGDIAGAGGVLYHYNPPYGDIYMEISQRFRRKGLRGVSGSGIESGLPSGYEGARRAMARHRESGQQEDVAAIRICAVRKYCGWRLGLIHDGSCPFAKWERNSWSF